MSEKLYKHEMPYNDGWKKKRGPLPVKMTSDYLFRALLQCDEKTLIAMVCDLLHMDPEEITYIEVTNPIEIGDVLDDKEFHLDVHVNLNNEKDVNLEMQVVHEKDWNIRSLLYACRSLDGLSHGQDYIESGSVIQISFTDFDLFKDGCEFYSSYMLVNIKNPKQIYCDKMLISNVNLKRIDLATEEDKAYRIDHWAKMFKAKTWEDICMLAAQDKEIDQAASSMWQLTEDRKIREQIRRREANINNYNRKEKMLADLKEQVKVQGEQLKSKDDQLRSKDDQLKSKDDQLRNKDDQLEEKDRLIAELRKKLEELEGK